jgi:archaellum component FlaF (FlaF/FlaG flagellin family)
MGFSLVASAAILGVTFFMAAEIVTSNVLPAIEHINESYDKMKDRYDEQLQTRVNITHVARSLNGTSYDYNISVQNTGSVTLDIKDFVVLMNGTQVQFTSSHSYLYPENVVYFQIVNSAGDGLKRMKIVANYGIADYYIFTP